ncbi:MAG: TolC family protein [Clostridiaceae bacterium]|nr:TolC family protein [Clostridiaceae bacterium]
MKKVISMILIVSLVGLFMQVSGENSNSITYDKAKTTMIANNRTLKKLGFEERKMFLNYNSAIQNTKNLKTDGMTYNFGGREFFFEFDDYLKLDLTVMKEHMPEELKYYWAMIGKNKAVTEKALALGLRDLYLGLMKSDKDIEIVKRKFELAQNKHSINQLKYEQGLIIMQELDESEFELLKAEKAVDEANRNRENMVRSLNSMLGVEISTVYETVKFDELSRELTFKPLEYYLEKALNERLEIKNIEEELRLKELKKSIFTGSRLFGKSYSLEEQYEDLELEIEVLKVKLEKAKYDIENEIKKAYIAINEDLHSLESTTETIKMQRRTLDKLKTQYERGFIPKILLDEMEIGIDELENAKELVIYSYNTKIMKLEEAAGLGPAY